MESSFYVLHPQAMAVSAQLNAHIKLEAFGVSPCVWRGMWDAFLSHILTDVYFPVLVPSSHQSRM